MLELSNVPKPLLEEVEKYLSEHPKAAVLHVSVQECTYLSAIYTVYVENNPSVSVFTLVCMKDGTHAVYHDKTCVSDIKVFLEHSDLFR